MTSELPVVPEGKAEGNWIVEGGTARQLQAPPAQWQGDTEMLTYNNPFNLELERVWFEGKIVYAVELGELDIDPDAQKVAQEYQIVYDIELDDSGKPKQEPERVEGQYNIYDSVPGMDNYSPLWQFNYVVVPRDYEPNALRSEKDCRESDYPIFKSKVIEN